VSDEGYVALRALVNIARNEQIRCLSTLKRVMIQRGFQSEHITEAITTWRSYEESKKYGSSDTALA
jgi:hypothetical protein